MDAEKPKDMGIGLKSELQPIINNNSIPN